MSKLVPCPIITAHPNGFVERTEPERETHEVRCVPSNVKPRGNLAMRCFAGDPTRPRTPVPARPARIPTDPYRSSRSMHTSPLTLHPTPPRFPSNSAYKLGKKKRSYNQVELTFDRATAGSWANATEAAPNGDVLGIYEATERGFSMDVPENLRDSALEYELRLYNGTSVRALIYLVYAEPLSRGQSASAGKSSKGFTANGSAALTDKNGNTWLPVTRSRCAKGCQGPILSAIQRFGKQGRTQKGAPGASAPDANSNDRDKWKDARNLFISIDEASNHVTPIGPNKCKIFRYVSAPPYPVHSSPRAPPRSARAARPLSGRTFRSDQPTDFFTTVSQYIPTCAHAPDLEYRRIKHTGCSSGSSPRPATSSSAPACPALSACWPTTTCPRVRRACASEAP